MNLEDEITKLLRNISQAFGAKHPIRFGISLCIGVATKGIVTILAAKQPDIEWLKTASEMSIIFYLAFFLVFAFATLRLFGDPLVSERFASYLRRIEEIMDRAGFSEVEKRQKWRELYEEYAKRFPESEIALEKSTEAEDKIED
jgi:hypothetical protein